MRRSTSTSEQAESAQTPAAPAPLLTVTDVAHILGLSRVKVYDLIKKQHLPSLKIDGARRIQPHKLQAWIEQHQQ